MKSVSPSEFVVKVCGITEEEDGRLALASGANALGFNFYRKSARYLEVERAHALVQSLGTGYLRVGVFVNPTLADLTAALERVPLDVIQLHGDYCATPPQNIRVWRSVTLPATSFPKEAVEAFLLDSPTPQFGGSGRTFDWSLAAGFPHRAILAGGLDGSNVADAIRSTHPWGVDACSRLESTPGRKDASRVRAFVQAALCELTARPPAETRS
jgi:phosphoribosylanthranilate isomerase